MEGITGTISRIAGAAYYVAPSGIGRGELGPMESCVAGLVLGDRVAVVPLCRGGYVIVGQLPAAA